MQLGAEAAEAAGAAVEAGGPAQAAEAVGCGRPVGGLWSANGITPPAPVAKEKYFRIVGSEHRAPEAPTFRWKRYFRQFAV